MPCFTEWHLLVTFFVLPCFPRIEFQQFPLRQCVVQLFQDFYCFAEAVLSAIVKAWCGAPGKRSTTRCLTKECEAIMNIGEVMEMHRGHLMTLTNVIGVGLGEKDGTPVIKVFVTDKLPEIMLKPQDIVPKVLDGHETDVEEIGNIRAL
jgi:hypothetical protein